MDEHPRRQTLQCRTLDSCHLAALLFGMFLLFMPACISEPGCPGSTNAEIAVDLDSPRVDSVFASQGNPYFSGSLTVRTLNVDQCEAGAPVPLRIQSPTQPGAYPVVVFQHGFMGRNSDYDEICKHVASHGLIVVAPQMYSPGISALLGNPTAAEEARNARKVIDWIRTRLSSLEGITPVTSRIGLAGHSRGGKVAWLVLRDDPQAAIAVAGVDPVDGRGGPAGNQQRAIDGQLDFSIPALVIGAGLGGSCAPLGDNHEQFYAASRSPAWHVVATKYGHGDMLDEDSAGSAAFFCDSGSDRQNMRALVAGLLTAHFRAHLQDDPSAISYLSDSAAAPTEVEMESR